MKVSIITSCYNREATIRGAIESVLEQDYPYIEYIVVDGASKDNSLAVINEYKNGIDTIISEPDKVVGCIQISYKISIFGIEGVVPTIYQSDFR